MYWSYNLIKPKGIVRKFTKRESRVFCRINLHISLRWCKRKSLWAAVVVFWRKRKIRGLCFTTTEGKTGRSVHCEAELLWFYFWLGERWTEWKFSWLFYQEKCVGSIMIGVWETGCTDIIIVTVTTFITYTTNRSHFTLITINAFVYRYERIHFSPIFFWEKSKKIERNVL